MTRPYRPANGCEGVAFQEEFCFRCVKDALYRETDNGADGCEILSRTYLYSVTDSLYPQEWVSDEVGPRCTAFEAEKGEK